MTLHIHSIHLFPLLFGDPYICFIVYLHRKSVGRSLPSAFLSKRRLRQTAAVKQKLFTYDRDILCLPKSYEKEGRNIKIPRGTVIRDYLASNGLIGKIRLTSDMNEKAIFDEIRSVFKGPMNESRHFQFSILQQTGGASKSLTVPAVSSSFSWTASAVAGKNSKVPIYIIAREELKVCVYFTPLIMNLSLLLSVILVIIRDVNLM